MTHNEEGIKEVNKKGDKMALMFDYATKLIESRKFGLPLKAPFLFISFNLMLYAAASVLFLRSCEPFFLKTFLGGFFFLFFKNNLFHYQRVTTILKKYLKKLLVIQKYCVSLHR